MQDLQNYQYYDPSPQLQPVPWWQRPRTWQLLGLMAVAGVILVFVVIALVNVVKNRQLAGDEQDLMGQAKAIESQLGSDCEEGDSACLDRATADAARSLGYIQACDELQGQSLVNCVTLIAQDTANPEACNALSGAERTTCADSANLLAAGSGASLASCDLISDSRLAASCRFQTRAKIIAQGTCVEEGIDPAECELAAAVSAAIKTGDPAACAALAEEAAKYDCERAIDSVDGDSDGLVLADEFSRGLSDAVADSDSDGLSDGDEVHVYATDPGNPDTDGDGFSDGIEVDGGYDPLQ